MEKSGILEGKIFGIGVLGCRTNIYEAEALASMLEARGARYVEDSEEYDFFVAVTCSITSVADAKTRKLLRRIKRRNPLAVLVACGCFAQSCGDAAARELGVDILVGNRRKESIPDLLEKWFGERNFLSDVNPSLVSERVWDALSLDRPRLHTRAFIKVQDGCSRRCSYCVVPSVRGMQVSRDPGETVEEISRVVKAGCREVVLTGIHLGSYGHGDTSIGGLVRVVSGIKGLSRLRLGSIEPFAVGDDLLSVLAESEIFCPHVHIPMQSGDDGVLASMKRGYSAGDFARTAERIRGWLGEDVHISTDLMVGFPGEDERAFRNSLDLISSLALGKIHVFPFSARRGTEAAAMPGAPAAGVVRDRVARAVDLSCGLLAKYASNFVGRRNSIMVEEEHDGLASGWTPNYLRAVARFDEKNSAKSRQGYELSVYPKSQVGGILLEQGIDPATVIDKDVY